jgi:hypothetical protein
MIFQERWLLSGAKHVLRGWVVVELRFNVDEPSVNGCSLA